MLDASVVRIARRFVGALALAAFAIAPAGAQQRPMKIGSILSVTGPAAFLGGDMRLAFEMAVDDINAAGGINGKKVEWIFYDSESQTAKAISSARRLISLDNVDIIVGGGNMSGLALAISPMAEKAGMPFISVEGATQIVAPVADHKFGFKAMVDDDKVIARILDFLKKKGVKKVAMLADSSGFGQSATEQMKKLSPGSGIDVVYESFNPADTDLTPQLTNIKNAGVQGIICWTVTPAGVVFLKQTQQLGMDKLVRIHGFGFVDQRYMELAGDSADGLVLSAIKFVVGNDLPDSDAQKKRIVDLTRRFKERHGPAPNQYAGPSYDAIMLAKVAFEKAGGDKEKMPAAFESISNYSGMGGSLTFGPQQHSAVGKDDIVMVGYKNGAFFLIDYK